MTNKKPRCALANKVLRGFLPSMHIFHAVFLCLSLFAYIIMKKQKVQTMKKGLSSMSVEGQKRSSDSRTIMTQLIFPLDTNHYDTMFGGKLMEYMDKVAAIAAMRHARTRVVTASTDSLDFLAPIRVGEVIEVEAFVSWTHRSSMEIYVSVTAENLYAGTRAVTVTAFFTFVALGEDGKPCPVPSVLPESELELQLFASAPDRHQLRKNRKKDRLGN